MATVSSLQTALNAEIAARKAADSAEAKTRATAVTQINGRLDAMLAADDAIRSRLLLLETNEEDQDVTIASLLLRVAALEGGGTTPPPPIPPPVTLTDQPAGTLQTWLNGHAGGTVPPGIYHELVTISQPGTYLFGGSIITGDNTRTEWVRIAASNVEIQDLVCKDAAVGAHQAGSFSTSGDNRDNFVGRRLNLSYGQATILKFQNCTGAQFIDCDIHHGRESLFSFNKANNCTFSGGKLHDALGTWPGFNPGDEGGAGKYGGYDTVAANLGSSGMTFDGVEVYTIVGRGLWGDIVGNDLTVQNCRIHDVQYEGVMFEISDGATIQDNVVWRCGRTNPSWGFGSGILIASSRNAIVRRNVVYDCGRGITALSQNRNQAGFHDFNPGMTGVQISDNTIIAKNASDIYLAGFFRDWSDPLFYGGTNTASGNLYWHPATEPSPAGRFYRSRTTGAYDGDYSTLAAFKTALGDTTSRYLSTAEKDAALAAAGIS